ncbi:MAG: hypothetical protein KC457_14150, partial [Myxococcales bacterium]|nr:hypothetical protein [Myxococcales bacterium]
GRYHLSRLDFSAPWAALVADEGPPIPAPTWTAVLSIDAHVRGYDIRPDGAAVALTYEGDVGVDVGLVPLPGPGAEPGPLRPLIDDALEHREVVFRPHHDELLFRTRLRLSLQGASVMAVQVLPVRAP